MQPRLEIQTIAPQAYRAMAALESYIRNSGLEPALLELVKLRASQINGCAYCIDMHSKDARSKGETEQRLYGLTAWREMPFYTERERAAFALTEAVTLIADGWVSDEIYAQVQKQFSEEEIVKLMIAISII